MDEENAVDFPYRTHTPLYGKLEKFKERLASQATELPDDMDYGTEDASVPASNVPCGGCGAHLHCRSASVPGYLPAEVFTAYDKHGLRGQICQRCRFIKEHNIALNVQVSAEDYAKGSLVIFSASVCSRLLSKLILFSSHFRHPR